MDIILWVAGFILFILACAYVLEWATKPDPNVIPPEKLARYDLPDDEITPRRMRQSIKIHRGDKAS
jgi:hypothetical protein